ncbi:hypothetical protein JCGZ_22717 [Jatropha curcas]|uniref:Uncharacterized protein n=1 Tax=Jatropha curcas TaxID=180498 RepID=A0A067JQ26_JATCU|nr:hypothetical protein JCGZ_22717 [Jatropha curcas]
MGGEEKVFTLAEVFEHDNPKDYWEGSEASSIGATASASKYEDRTIRRTRMVVGFVRIQEMQRIFIIDWIC